MRRWLAGWLWRCVVLFKPVHLGLSLRARKWVNHLIWNGRGSNHSNPLVFVQVAAYNAESTVQETLESLLGQTYSNWVAVIVNDGSSDHTAEVCKQYSRRDSRFVLLEHEENGGLNHARNTALVYAREHLEWDVMAVLDSDDVANPKWLEIGVEGLGRGALAVRCLNGRYNWDLSSHRYDYMACAQTFFIRSVLDDLGGYRLAPFTEDHDMMERLEKYASLTGGFVLTTPVQVQKMRFHDRNLSVTEIKKPERVEARKESERIACQAKSVTDVKVRSEAFPHRVWS